MLPVNHDPPHTPSKGLDVWFSRNYHYQSQMLRSQYTSTILKHVYEIDWLWWLDKPAERQYISCLEIKEE